MSQAAEDVFPLLAPALPSESALDLLAPMALTEKHPMLLGIIKLLTKVASLVDGEYLESKLGDVVPGVIRGYSHSESSVRKASVFCLVAIHAVVGNTMREHLIKLSSSQVHWNISGLAPPTSNWDIFSLDKIAGLVHQKASTRS